MKRIDRIRAREAARICLIEARNLLHTARDKLLEIQPGNAGLKDNFHIIFEHHTQVLTSLIDEQSEEV